MKILVCGAGAIGSNLVARLVSDLKGEHKITVLDKDTVEQRNIQAGTQFYTPDQIGLSKVEALQFNIYKNYQREIELAEGNLTDKSAGLLIGLFDLVIDCFDNEAGRSAIQKHAKETKIDCLHIGFSDQYTFAVEWADNYKVPSNIEGLDICELPGAAAFVNSVASLGALVAEEYILNDKKIEILGGKFEHKMIR